MEVPIQLSEIYTQKILDEIKHGVFANSSRLPPESEIAKQFGISRTLIRDCLAILEREGFISRKHGIGTLVNQHVLGVKTRIDLEQEFLEMFSSVGMKPEISFTHNYHTKADVLLAENLKIEEGEDLLCSERLILADGIPAIYCMDYVPIRNICTKDYDEKILEKPIFEFLKLYCNTTVDMDLSEIMAIVADETLAEFFRIEKGSPILYMNEVGYSFNGKPVLFSKEYYRQGILKQTILRKKI